MSARSRTTGAQFAVLLLGVAALAGLVWLVLILLRPPAGVAAPAMTPTPVGTATFTLTPSPSPTATATATITPSPTRTPTPTPLAPLACLPPEAPREEAQVVAVINGAYIEVRTANARFFVRYLGVDPTGDGQAAAALNRSLVEGQTVTLVENGVDSDDQGNRLRYVLAGERFVNFELVRQGAALAGLYPLPSICLDTFLAAEGLARAEKLGYWAALGPAPLQTFPVDQTPPCDCRLRYSCTDFASQSDAQACYNACGDYRNAGLDPDHNGLACDE